MPIFVGDFTLRSHHPSTIFPRCDVTAEDTQPNICTKRSLLFGQYIDYAITLQVQQVTIFMHALIMVILNHTGMSLSVMAGGSSKHHQYSP